MNRLLWSGEGKECNQSQTPTPTPRLSCVVVLVQFGVATKIIQKDGFGALYKGLSAGLLRQATYTTARLGIFNNLSVALKDYNQGKVRMPWARTCPHSKAGDHVEPGAAKA